QREGAIAAALDAPDLGGKGQLQRFGRGTGLGHILVVEKALQGSLADLRMDLAVVFQLDPRLAHVVELVQSQVGHPFKHRQEPALDLAPKNLLLAILIRTCARINSELSWEGGCSSIPASRGVSEGRVLPFGGWRSERESGNAWY